MDKNQPTPAKSRRSKKTHARVSFTDDSFKDDDDDIDVISNVVIEDPELSNKIESASESLKEMTEEEMAEHLKLCMKLSAENKINVKNAFGLRLIDIMKRMVNKSEKIDIQQASLSLHASSKIYAGRVEALYQDTMKFHSQLQSIVSGGKKEKKKTVEDDIDGEDDDPSDKGKNKPAKSKCKSSLKSEENLTIEQDISSLSMGQPHGNFVTINAAFSTSRLAPKLISSLQLSDDSCILRCALPELCFKLKKAFTNESFVVSPKFGSLLEKAKNINVSQTNFESLSESTDVPPAPYMSTPKPCTPPSALHEADDDGVFAVPGDFSLMAGPSDDVNSVESAIEKFDVLNITADVFVNNISAAMTNQGVDHKLLPPNSVLKKMLDQSKRTSIRPSTTKTTKRKAKEPFFAGKSANEIKHLFVKGRATTVSQKLLSEWSAENTSNIDLSYEFIAELESINASENGCGATTLDQVLDVMKQNDPQYHFKYYFNKQSQIWRFSRRKLCIDESFGGTPCGNQTERRVASLAPNDPEGLALSFQNLSLHDSIHQTPDSVRNMSPDNGAPDFIDSEEQQFVVPLEPFETDIEDLMVKPPELVRPASMKFDQRPVNLNTEKIKELLWQIISRHLERNNNSSENQEPFVLFSVVYEELKVMLEREISEFISMQFSFVVLLILANHKTLLIENVKEDTDLSIKQDVSEIEVSNNM